MNNEEVNNTTVDKKVDKLKESAIPCDENCGSDCKCKGKKNTFTLITLSKVIIIDLDEE
jgi:hypothetical protein